jgi:hypothetical protein
MTKGCLVPSAFVGDANPLASAAPLPLAGEGELGREEEEGRRESRRSPLKWGLTTESMTPSVVVPLPGAAVAGVRSWRSLRSSEVLTRGGGGPVGFGWGEAEAEESFRGSCLCRPVAIQRGGLST